MTMQEYWQWIKECIIKIEKQYVPNQNKLDHEVWESLDEETKLYYIDALHDLVYKVDNSISKMRFDLDTSQETIQKEENKHER